MLLLALIIISILFFTYKPLFKHLSANSYSPMKLYKAISNEQSVKDEFGEFFENQMNVIKKFTNKLFKKDSKEQEIKSQNDSEAKDVQPADKSANSTQISESTQAPYKVETTPEANKEVAENTTQTQANTESESKK